MNNYVMEYYNLDGEVARDKFTASSEEAPCKAQELWECACYMNGYDYAYFYAVYDDEEVFIRLFDREDNEDY